MNKAKLLIFIVSYNASKTITEVLDRIPRQLLESDLFSAHILLIDDCSKDRTFDVASAYDSSGKLPVALTVIQNPDNLGYGGNQKVGYRYAIDNNFDFVALLHGDSQYAPEELPVLLQPLLNKECDAVFGSRMIRKSSALRGGMPIYKFAGNIILSFLQNTLVRANLSEFHSGYRLYSVAALKSIPLDLNSSGFDFDTDIILQLLASGYTIKELPIPTHYGDEMCHVNGLRYAWTVLLTSLKYRLQHLGLFYDPKFDLSNGLAHYEGKFDFASSHQFAISEITSGQNILILGCGGWSLVEPFIAKGANVYVVDQIVEDEIRGATSGYIEADLEGLNIDELFPDIQFDVVLALDVLEHLKSPQRILDTIRNTSNLWNARLIISCPNVSFAPLRIMFLLGFFNQGKRGILDETHIKHFTYFSLKRFLEQYGFRVCSRKGVPAPFPLALGRKSKLARFLVLSNTWGIRYFPGLFSYQTFCCVQAVPTPARLLSRAMKHTTMLKERKTVN